MKQPLEKISTESIRAIARNPKKDLISKGIYSKSDIQQHIRTQPFHELVNKMDTIQRQSINQNLQKLAETAGFSNIYRQNNSGPFEDLKKYIHLKREKYHSQINSPPINNFRSMFNFFLRKKELRAFLGWS